MKGFKTSLTDVKVSFAEFVDSISSDEEKMNEILDGLDDTIADCLIDISNHVSELETNLEEFQYLADDIPSVWAI